MNIDIINMHFHSDYRGTAILVGPFRISYHSNPEGWHKNGYDKRVSTSRYIEKNMITREIGFGRFAIAFITHTPNPNFIDQ